MKSIKIFLPFPLLAEDKEKIEINYLVVGRQVATVNKVVKVFHENVSNEGRAGYRQHGLVTEEEAEIGKFLIF